MSYIFSARFSFRITGGLFFLLMLTFVSAGCRNSARSDNKCIAEFNGDSISVVDSMQYAEYLKISGDTVETINDWKGKAPVAETFILVPRDSVKLLANNPNAIPVPVRSCVCMSTSFLAYLNVLGQSSSVKALSGTQFVYNEGVKKLIAEGKIADIGAESAPNYEKIMSLKPDVIFAYGISGNDNTYIEKLRHLGLRVIPINDYLERTPLAKMEYFKFFGLVTGTEHAADSIFASRAKEYVKIKNDCAKKLADKHIKKTKVLLNMPFKDMVYSGRKELHIKFDKGCRRRNTWNGSGRKQFRSSQF